MKRLIILGAFVGSIGCAERDPQNSAMCGLTFMASGNRVLDQLATGSSVLQTPPEAMLQGYVPTRVVGHAASRSLAAADDGKVVLGYEGEGLPELPGFGLALVDDSIEIFRGVLIFAPAPPPYTELGSVTSASHSVPLFGIRIHWSSVNSDRCPLFPSADTTTTQSG